LSQGALSGFSKPVRVPPVWAWAGHAGTAIPTNSTMTSRRRSTAPLLPPRRHGPSADPGDSPTPPARRSCHSPSIGSGRGCARLGPGPRLPGPLRRLRGGAGRPLPRLPGYGPPGAAGGRAAGRGRPVGGRLRLRGRRAGGAGPGEVPQCSLRRPGPRRRPGPPDRAIRAGRRRQRGFDPADPLARAVARSLGVPVRRCLSRVGGPSQTGRSAGERRRGPAFRAVRPVAGLRVLVVDDVATTGATLAAAARALRAAGARGVAAATVAATPRRRPPSVPVPEGYGSVTGGSRPSVREPLPDMSRGPTSGRESPSGGAENSRWNATRHPP